MRCSRLSLTSATNLDDIWASITSLHIEDDEHLLYLVPQREMLTSVVSLQCWLPQSSPQSVSKLYQLLHSIGKHLKSVFIHSCSAVEILVDFLNLNILESLFIPDGPGLAEILSLRKLPQLKHLGVNVNFAEAEQLISVTGQLETLYLVQLNRAGYYGSFDPSLLSHVFRLLAANRKTLKRVQLELGSSEPILNLLCAGVHKHFGAEKSLSLSQCLDKIEEFIVPLQCFHDLDVFGGEPSLWEFAKYSPRQPPSDLAIAFSKLFGHLPPPRRFTILKDNIVSRSDFAEIDGVLRDAFEIVILDLLPGLSPVELEESETIWLYWKMTTEFGTYESSSADRRPDKIRQEFWQGKLLEALEQGPAVITSLSDARAAARCLKILLESSNGAAHFPFALKLISAGDKACHSTFIRGYLAACIFSSAYFDPDDLHRHADPELTVELCVSAMNYYNKNFDWASYFAKASRVLRWAAVKLVRTRRADLPTLMLHSVLEASKPNVDSAKEFLRDLGCVFRFWIGTNYPVSEYVIEAVYRFSGNNCDLLLELRESYLEVYPDDRATILGKFVAGVWKTALSCATRLPERVHQLLEEAFLAVGMPSRVLALDIGNLTNSLTVRESFQKILDRAAT